MHYFLFLGVPKVMALNSGTMAKLFSPVTSFEELTIVKTWALIISMVTEMLLVVNLKSNSFQTGFSHLYCLIMKIARFVLAVFQYAEKKA